MNQWPLFFGGVDTAPSETERSDPGATVVLAAQPRQPTRPNEPRPSQESDYRLSYCYGRLFTSAHRLRATQWSGYLYGLHERFGFTRLCMDAGAGGGGVFVKREMMQVKQLINETPRIVSPIVDQTPESAQMVTDSAQFILTMFKRGDPGIDAVWPDPTGSKALAGDDLLKESLLANFRWALRSIIEMPPEADEYIKTHPETAQWDRERLWALKILSAGVNQLGNIVMETTEKNGEQVAVHTSRGARKFTCLGHDDIAMAMMYAYAAFRVWLLNAGDEEPDGDEASGFMG